jgi:hypothetical protein
MAWIRRAVFASVPFNFRIKYHVDVGVLHAIVGVPRPNFETDSHRFALIDEVMSIRRGVVA